MNVLILGSGGREHAFALKISKSPLLSKLFVAPGNAGTLQIAENVNLNITDFDSVRSFVTTNNIELVLVGPEVPLVAGITDFFKQDHELKNVMIIGPGKAGAMLEGSKKFSKEFMIRHQIPTARYQSFDSTSIDAGIQFLKSLQAPYVLKADGLAAGKGVLIPETLEDAISGLRELLSGQFGEASSKVVIEEFLPGIEMSAFVITDGVDYKILPEAKDYKRIGEGDTGLNTGGMGAISPVPFANNAFLDKIETQIIRPTIDGLNKEDIEYCGFIFFGIMKVKDDPYVIEYNCRMGDPETEVVIPRIKSDFLELLIACAKGNLKNSSIEIDPRYATTVMLVSGGYPQEFEKNKVISKIPESTDTIVFHAGTAIKDHSVVTSGGRVLALTSMRNELSDAVSASLKCAAEIQYEGKYFRRDIGQDLLRLIEQE